jgi:rod shape determining protein RodA
VPRKLTQRLDWSLLAVVVLLVIIGCTMVYSSTRAEKGGQKLMLQLVWVALGVVLLASVTIVDYNRLVNLALPFMGVCIFLLLVVLVSGHVTKGASRWIDLGPMHLQPSEMLKLAVILFLGGFLAHHEEETQDFALVLRALVYVGAPTVLVLAQPDLGTPVLLFLVWNAMLFLSGARVVHLGGIAFAFLMLFTAAWGLNIIKQHQKDRIIGFLNPDADPRGHGYNLKQSLIAIGSGHVAGKGLFRGTQSRLQFVPEQETDFIFTVVGEETGFVGSVALLALFGFLLYRTLAVAAVAKDMAGRVMAGGIATMFLVHVLVNIGMTIGLMPVKGMPLPFVSYGGSNMLTMMAAVGLLQSIYIHRQKITF